MTAAVSRTDDYTNKLVIKQRARFKTEESTPGWTNLFQAINQDYIAVTSG